VILRLEDLDASRVRQSAIAEAMIDLRWLGLDWDEGPDLGGPSAPYLQSLRHEHYQRALERLQASEQIYPCTCTRAEIERAASAPHPEDEEPLYPGTCSHRRARDAQRLGDRPFAWRFRVPEGFVAWHDLIGGPMELEPRRIGGDFLVARNLRGPSYQLAVVVDDALMGVTQVVRGADLISSTPRQLLLYRALGLQEPEFGHVPLAVGPEGRKLAKREGSLKLATLRERGVEPRRLVAELIRSCGQTGLLADASPWEWVDRFELHRLPREPWVVRPDWLASLLSPVPENRVTR